jgi:Flp pilus assembly protein TadG
MRSGAVAVIFALAAIPIFLMLGVAVDYGRATLAKSHLQGAVDSAAIQVGAQALAQPNLTQAQLQQLAANMVAVNLGASAASLNLSVTETTAPGGAGWNVTATGSFQTSILQLAGVSSVPFSATAQSASQLTTPGGTPITNINVHLLVDTSQSMGVGADASDQAGMSSSDLQCSYACHSSVAAYTTTTDACRGPSNAVTVTDGVAYAHQQGYTLRIDAIKTALTNLINKASANAAANGATINLALYTFANNFQTVQALTNNYTALRAAVAGLDIAGASASGGGGTSLQAALQQVQAQIGTSGDGTSASSPLNYVVLISDGLYDDANPLASTYAPAPASTCTTNWTCVDYFGNNCGAYNNGQCNNYDHDHNNNNCQPQSTQTCTTSGPGVVGNPASGSSDSLYNGNIGNASNVNNVFNYAIDANANLLTGAQTNADHWSVGAAISGTLCYPNAATPSNPIGVSPYVTPAGTVNAPPCIPDPVNGGNFELAPINPSWCAPLTSAGATVVTLYTTYMLDNPTPTAPTDSQYYDWRVYYMQNYPGFLTSLQTNMAACASSSKYAYQATTSTDITTTVASIFNSVTTAPLHLVK